MNPLAALADVRRRWLARARACPSMTAPGTCASRRSWAPRSASSCGARSPRGRVRDRRGDGRNAAHRRGDEPAQTGVGAVAHQPRRVARSGAALRRDGPLVARAIDFSALSDGAFDISYAAVGALYDYRAGIAPTDARSPPRRARAVGWQHLLLDRDAPSLRFGREGMRIDLAASPRAMRWTTRRRSSSAAASRTRWSRPAATAVIGGDRRGALEHRDPRSAPRGRVVAVLPLTDVAISTSGDYERYFIQPDGVRCHHLIDPRSGRSPSSVRSVTIPRRRWPDRRGAVQDVFVLGVEAGLRLVHAQPGVDAVVIDAAAACTAPTDCCTPARQRGRPVQ